MYQKEKKDVFYYYWEKNLQPLLPIKINVILEKSYIWTAYHSVWCKQFCRNIKLSIIKLNANEKTQILTLPQIFSQSTIIGKTALKKLNY